MVYIHSGFVPVVPPPHDKRLYNDKNLLMSYLVLWILDSSAPTKDCFSITVPQEDHTQDGNTHESGSNNNLYESTTC